MLCLITPGTTDIGGRYNFPLLLLRLCTSSAIFIYGRHFLFFLQLKLQNCVAVLPTLERDSDVTDTLNQFTFEKVVICQNNSHSVQEVFFLNQ